MVYRNFMFTATIALLASMIPVDALPVIQGGRGTSPLAEVSVQADAEVQAEADAEKNGGRSTNPMAEVESKTTASTQGKAGAKSQASN